MKNQRFPRLAYVHQLERMYDELGGWREAYGSLLRDFPSDRSAGAYKDRNAELADIQHQLLRAITKLYGLRPLS